MKASIKVIALLQSLEGINARIESGVTDEGDRWFAAGESHLAIGKDARLFRSWQLVLVSPGIDELSAQVSYHHP